MSSAGNADSWEKLRDDAVKSYEGYWGCDGVLCEDCPAEVGGKKPCDHYGTVMCDHAARIDVLARAERLAGCDTAATGVRRSCDTCRWWKKPPNVYIGPCGTCKRYPQIAAKLPKDWCGEWKEARR